MNIFADIYGFHSNFIYVILFEFALCFYLLYIRSIQPYRYISLHEKYCEFAILWCRLVTVQIYRLRDMYAVPSLQFNCMVVLCSVIENRGWKWNVSIKYQEKDRKKLLNVTLPFSFEFKRCKKNCRQFQKKNDSFIWHEFWASQLMPSNLPTAIDIVWRGGVVNKNNDINCAKHFIKIWSTIRL